MNPHNFTRLDSLVLKITELRQVFEFEIQNGKTFEEVKVIHLEIKEVLRQIEQLQIIYSNQNVGNKN